MTSAIPVILFSTKISKNEEPGVPEPNHLKLAENPLSESPEAIGEVNEYAV
jgi:hypothetical protein